MAHARHSPETPFMVQYPVLQDASSPAVKRGAFNGTSVEQVYICDGACCSFRRVCASPSVMCVRCKTASNLWSVQVRYAFVAYSIMCTAVFGSTQIYKYRRSYSSAHYYPVFVRMWYLSVDTDQFSNSLSNFKVNWVGN